MFSASPAETTSNSTSRDHLKLNEQRPVQLQVIDQVQYLTMMMMMMMMMVVVVVVVVVCRPVLLRCR